MDFLKQTVSSYLAVPKGSECVYTFKLVI